MATTNNQQGKLTRVTKKHKTELVSALNLTTLANKSNYHNYKNLLEHYILNIPYNKITKNFKNYYELAVKKDISNITSEDLKDPEINILYNIIKNFNNINNSFYNYKITINNHINYYINQYDMNIIDKYDKFLIELKNIDKSNKYYYYYIKFLFDLEIFDKPFEYYKNNYYRTYGNDRAFYDILINKKFQYIKLVIHNNTNNDSEEHIKLINKYIINVNNILDKYINILNNDYLEIENIIKSNNSNDENKLNNYYNQVRILTTLNNYYFNIMISINNLLYRNSCNSNQNSRNQHNDKINLTLDEINSLILKLNTYYDLYIQNNEKLNECNNNINELSEIIKLNNIDMNEYNEVLCLIKANNFEYLTIRYLKKLLDLCLNELNDNYTIKQKILLTYFNNFEGKIQNLEEDNNFDIYLRYLYIILEYFKSYKELFNDCVKFEFNILRDINNFKCIYTNTFFYIIDFTLIFKNGYNVYNVIKDIKKKYTNLYDKIYDENDVINQQYSNCDKLLNNLSLLKNLFIDGNNEMYNLLHDLDFYNNDLNSFNLMYKKSNNLENILNNIISRFNDYFINTSINIKEFNIFHKSKKLNNKLELILSEEEKELENFKKFDSFVREYNTITYIHNILEKYGFTSHENTIIEKEYVIRYLIKSINDKSILDKVNVNFYNINYNLFKLYLLAFGENSIQFCKGLSYIFTKMELYDLFDRTYFDISNNINNVCVNCGNDKGDFIETFCGCKYCQYCKFTLFGTHKSKSNDKKNHVLICPKKIHKTKL